MMSMVRPVPAHRRLGLACALLVTLTTNTSAADHPPIRGLLVAREHATISSRLDATILAIGPDNGEAFAAGHVLVAFDCTRYAAELERARAAAAGADDALAIKRELARGGSASRLQAVLAEADLKRAAAEVAVAAAQVGQCEIRAPYAGRVVRRIANAHETVGFGTELIEIAGTSTLEVRMFVPSSSLGRLRTGDRLAFDIEETGTTVEAAIVATGAWIDNVSKLAEVRAQVIADDGGTAALVPGMSGTVRLPAQTLAGQGSP
jgi:RND family efflux transporter MFP subunit